MVATTQRVAHIKFCVEKAPDVFWRRPHTPELFNVDSMAHARFSLDLKFLNMIPTDEMPLNIEVEGVRGLFSRRTRYPRSALFRNEIQCAKSKNLACTRDYAWPRSALFLNGIPCAKSKNLACARDYAWPRSALYVQDPRI